MNNSDFPAEGFEGVPEAVYAWLDGDSSSPVRAALDQWLHASPANQRRLEQMEQLWSLTATPSAPDGWHALNQRIDEIERKPKRDVLTLAQPALRLRFPLRAAAMLMVGVGVGALVPIVHRVMTATPEARIVVPAGSQSTLELAGGVTVRLNYASELTYAPSKNVREIQLKGEAYITVPDGAKHNFIVHTEAGVARDLGTEFNVRARDGMTSVTVTQGRVALGSEEGEVELAAGQESTVAIGGAPTPPAQIDLDAALGWLSKRLLFFDQPLDQVAQELENRYGVAFVIAANLRATRITAKIPADASASDAAQVICFTVEASCRKATDGWVIAR